MAELLGARATPVCADPAPPIYSFLPGIERLRTAPEPDVDYDLLVVSDCGTLERTGALLERHRDLLLGLPRVTIDHHVSNDDSGPADWIDPAAAATCEMTALLAVRLGVPLSAAGGALATNLMAGIVMDTATFAHPNATPRTLIGCRGPGRGRRAAVGDLAPLLPHQADAPAAALRADPGPARRRGTAG